MCSFADGIGGAVRSGTVDARADPPRRRLPRHREV